MHGTLHSGYRTGAERPPRRFGAAGRRDRALVSGPALARALDAGGGGGLDVPAWDSALAAVIHPAAPVLALPEIPADEVPQYLTLRRSDRGAALLAEAMLAERILREDDWCGAVAPSIGAGLIRWAKGILGGEDLQRIEIGLMWTDDLESVAPGMDTRFFRLATGCDPREPIALLGILGGQPVPEGAKTREVAALLPDVQVGAVAMQLEAQRPGLGFQVLRLLQEVLPKTACAACPFWARQQVMKAGALGPLATMGLAEIELPEDSPYAHLILPRHGVTPRAFDAAVPAEACTGEFRPGVIKEALRHALPPHLAEIVRLAADVIDLHKIPADAFRWDTHGLCAAKTVRGCDVPGAAMVEAPFAVRWSAVDPIVVVAEDWNRTIRDTDDATNMAWSQAWQPSDPKALRKAVRHFRQIVTLTLRCCLLAEKMHRDEIPEGADDDARPLP